MFHIFIKKTMLKYCKHSESPHPTLQYCIKIPIWHHDIIKIILKNISVLTKIKERLKDISQLRLTDFAPLESIYVIPNLAYCIALILKTEQDTTV